MKKSFSLFASILMTACLTSCSTKDKWVVPSFEMTSNEYKTKFVSNAEEDYNFPISGLKLSNANYDLGVFEYSWVIENSKNEVVGWINAGNNYSENNGKFNYGYTTTKYNGQLILDSTNLIIFLKGDESVFTDSDVSINVGTIEKSFNEPIKGSGLYSELCESNPQAKIDADKFVYMSYFPSFIDIDPSTIENVTFTLAFPNLKI